MTDAERVYIETVISAMTPKELRALWDVTEQLFRGTADEPFSAAWEAKVRFALTLDGLREKITVVREVVTKQALAYPTTGGVLIHAAKSHV